MRTITTIGAANIDVSATVKGPFVATANNPARVNFSYGGSARNVAHNLALLGEHVQLVTIFGGDVFGGFLMDNCRKHAIDIHLSERMSDSSTSTYVALLNPRGDRITAAVDDETVQHLTPLFLAERMSEIHDSSAVVMSCNLPIESMAYLLDHSDTQLYANAVSAQRVINLIEAFSRAKEPRLYAIKVSRRDALTATGMATVEQAADYLLALGIEYVYITMAQDGVYCRSREQETQLPPHDANLVSTTGAGDAFLAGVVLADLNNIPFPTTARFGLKVAAATIGAEGVVNPELMKIMQG